MMDFYRLYHQGDEPESKPRATAAYFKGTTLEDVKTQVKRWIALGMPVGTDTSKFSLRSIKPCEWPWIP